MGMRGLRGRRCVCSRVLARFRCRMRSVGCGFWSVWRAEFVYTIPLAVRLRGELDRVALEGALGDVVERHESLRTIFPERGGVPRQEVLSASAAGVGLSVSAVSEEELSGALTAAACIGFDLSREVPLRAHLFVLGEREHVLLLVLHHIAGDGWSLSPWGATLGSFTGRGVRVVRRRCCASGAVCRLYAVAAERTGDESEGESAISRQLSFWRDRLLGCRIRLSSV